jgi:hypothetical protein
MSIEQLSREIGDKRRSMASMIRSARELAAKRVELASSRSSCTGDALASVNKHLISTTLEHSRLLAEVTIQAVECDALELKLAELAYSQS